MDRTDEPLGPPTPPPRLLDQLRAELIVRHRSPRTAEAYCAWAKRFVLFHGKRHPRELDGDAVNAFLTHLTVEEEVSASTQNQARAAILFLYEKVLGVSAHEMGAFVRPKQPQRLPVVLSRDEVRRLLDQMQGETALMASLLYGAGLRLLECASLRVKDVDLERREINVRRAKGQKDRVVPLPEKLVVPLQSQLVRGRLSHASDRARGGGHVKVPALDRKYPNASAEWIWQWVFPASRTYTDRDSGEVLRHHLHETVIQRAVRTAAQAAGIAKSVNCHGLRHSFAAHLLEAGYSIRTIQQLLGHSDVSTTMVYTHVLRGALGVKSPLDD